MLRRLVFAGIALIGLAGAGGAAAPVAYEEFRGQRGPAEKGSYIARTASEWQALWRRIDQSPPKALKEGRETGLGVFLGARSTDRDTVQVGSVKKNRDTIRVRANIMKSGSVNLVSGTAPYVIVLIKDTASKVRIDAGDKTLKKPKPLN